MNRFAQEPTQPVRDRGKGAGEANFRSSGSERASNQQSGSGSTITSEVQSALDQQVVRGARMMSNVARSARRAAEELESDAPQIAGLVRGVADRVEEYSHTLEDQSASDIYRAASDFTRRQPALVFGVAALTGFFALRTLNSGRTTSAGETSSPRNEQFYGS
jgi:ElaB/YqjD/DUF883 family membrane-anchored ribosome-binding protein